MEGAVIAAAIPVPAKQAPCKSMARQCVRADRRPAQDAIAPQSGCYCQRRSTQALQLRQAHTHCHTQESLKKLAAAVPASLETAGRLRAQNVSNLRCDYAKIVDVNIRRIFLRFGAASTSVKTNPEQHVKSRFSRVCSFPEWATLVSTRADAQRLPGVRRGTRRPRLHVGGAGDVHSGLWACRTLP